MEQEMNPRFIRIAELIENLENVSKMIDLHRQVPQHESMVNQYESKREEFVEELRGIFKSLSIRLELTEVA
ncbi:MAG TPA: hypothetical protein PLC89_06480 [Haliscomenobacter sp.]|uniref:hypothetical protein n=1 Tax=Haliscomenobacter sp. TaxID=2717303 RepID=UPI002C5F40F0|nr:hypothetical protein [Haliscomenobacter sp.]HOY16915.1 hypothetical protein [Haliscomenobacter sp.]HPH21822.1 hypothetical protein [Haliscomenobacter sp.]